MADDLPNLALFSGRLKDAMAEANNMRPTDLAKALRVHRSLVTRWLGGAVPDMPQIAAIAVALNCSARWLVGQSQDPPGAAAAAEIDRLNQRIAGLTEELERLREVPRRVSAALREAEKPRRRASSKRSTSRI